MQILNTIRSKDWWDYKIPPLLAIGYATTLRLNVPIHTAVPELFFLLSAILIGAIYVSIMNDVTDVEEDRASGKPNRMAQFPAPVRSIVPVLCFACGIVFMHFLRQDIVSLLLYLLSWIAFTLYSLPPFRLKKRAMLGVLADACGAHLFPSLMMVSANTFFHHAEIDLFWFFAVGFWAFAYGARGILWHQFHDRKNDERAGLQTLAVKTSAAKLRLIEIALTLLELAALIVVLWRLAKPVVILFFALCLMLLLVRKIFFGARIVSVIEPESGPYHILFSDYYQFFLPVSILISDAWLHPSNWILVAAQLILFPTTTKVALRDLYGALRHIFRLVFPKRAKA